MLYYHGVVIDGVLIDPLSNAIYVYNAENHLTYGIEKKYT